jgi:hypothetical protein
LYAGLRDVQAFEDTVSLEQIRSGTEAIQDGIRQLEEIYGRPLYFPFESGANRPTRPLQGYLFKLPSFFVDLFPSLSSLVTVDTKPPSIRADGSVGNAYRRPDEETTVGKADPFSIDPSVVERGTRAHAVTQNALADYLGERGVAPLSPSPGDPSFDIAWMEGDTLWVAEVKSTTPENEEKQLRLGLPQLLRYVHLLQNDGSYEVKGVLMVENRPEDDTWLSLCSEMEIVLTWPGSFERIT